MSSLTPKQIVEALDKFIIGQSEAKRAVAVALRNRWRRQQLPSAIADEIMPKNIIMMGPTGVGKTEIARRLAQLADAPFIKVEATKFTEVGYVGRDVESMIRDLLELGIKIVREEQTELVRDQAVAGVDDRLLDLLLPRATPRVGEDFNEAEQRYDRTREKLHTQLKAGALDDKRVEVQIQERSPSLGMLSTMGLDQMGPDVQNMFDKMMPPQTRNRTMSVAEARQVLLDQEVEKLLDNEKITRMAIERTETSGIVFLDEMDKIAGEDGGSGPDVSRQGVQRDLLPIVEGSTVNTKHGPIRSDHILFIAAGAFHTTKPSDLMPELQGRFPLRVSLVDLEEADFVRILTEPQNALVKQQRSLMATENVDVEFTAEGVEEMARTAYKLNKDAQNIGARRLYAVMEKVLEEVSYEAPELNGQRIVVNAPFVRQRLSDVEKDEDLNVFGFRPRQ